MSTEEKEKLKSNIIVYTDGSGNLELKSWGCGYIGYLYTADQIDKEDKGPFKKLKPETLGFMSDELHQQDTKFYNESKPVNTSYIMLGFIKGDEPNTNNYAEAYVVNHVIKEIITLLDRIEETHEVKSILLKSDSNMVIMVMNSLINDPNVDINRFAYPALYREIYDNIQILKSKKVNLVCKHVYGHSGARGNHISDRLAYIGRLVNEESLKGEIIGDQSSSRSLLMSVDEFKKEPKTINNIIDLPFNTVIVNDPSTFSPKRGPYHILDYHDSEATMGSRSSEMLQGVIYDTEGDEFVDMLVTRAHSYKETPDIYYTVELNNVRNPLTKVVSKLGENVYTKSNRHGVLRLIEDIDLVKPIRPAGLITQLFDKESKRNLAIKALENYIKDPKSIDKTVAIKDITNMFFTENDNPKKNKYVCSLTGKESNLEIELDNEVKGIHILQFKTSVPSKRYFKKLEDMKELKVYIVSELVYKNETSKSICYGYDDYLIVIGERENGTEHKSVWNNFFSGKTNIMVSK